MANTTLYKFAAGWNNTGALALLNPQPKTHMTEWAQRYYSISGQPYSQGRYCELIFDALSLTQFNSLISTFGLSETLDAVKGTFSLRHDDGTYYNVNGIIVYPFAQVDKRRSLGFWSAVTFRVTHLVLL